MTEPSPGENEHHRLALLLPFIELLRACDVEETEILRIFNHPKTQHSSPQMKFLFDCIQKGRCFKPVLHPCPNSCFCSRIETDEISPRVSDDFRSKQCQDDDETIEKIVIGNYLGSSDPKTDLIDSIGDFTLPPSSYKDIHARKQRIKTFLKRSRDCTSLSTKT